MATGTGAGAAAGGMAGCAGWAGVTGVGAVSGGPPDACAPVGFVMGVVVRVLRVVDVRRRLAVRAPNPDPEPGTSEVVVTDASGTDEAAAAA